MEKVRGAEAKRKKGDVKEEGKGKGRFGWWGRECRKDRTISAGLVLDPPILLALSNFSCTSSSPQSLSSCPCRSALPVAPQILFDQQLSDTHTGKIVIKLQGYCIYCIIVLIDS